LGVDVWVAGTNQAEGCLQHLRCVAGFIWEGGLKGHRSDGAVTAILDRSIDVGQLISGKIAGLADSNIAENDIFRVGFRSAAGIGGRVRQPEGDTERAADHDKRNDPWNPVTFRPLRVTIH
jgi:hypothetical protein